MRELDKQGEFIDTEVVIRKINWTNKAKPFIFSLMPLNTLLRTTYKVLDEVLYQITYTPHGYIWFHSLSKKGKKSLPVLRKKWAFLLYKSFYTSSLHSALLKASLSSNGTPNNQGSLAYTWLLENIYRGNTLQLYKDWLAENEKGKTNAEL